MKTELVFILDRSGSMCGLEADTIGGFNNLIGKQKKEPGTARVTTVLFDNHYELLHDRVDVENVEPITGEDYFARGSTALLDAIGTTIEKIKKIQRTDRADRVMFVITTDGMENASRRFGLKQIRAQIEKLQREEGWEFLFLGANIDAIATAGSLGIHADRAVDFLADEQGVRTNFECVCEAVSSVRCEKPLSASWKGKAERDYQRRSKKQK